MSKKIFFPLFSLLFINISIFANEQTPDIIVAQDGTGDFHTIQEAVNSVRDFRPEGRTVIFIKKGIYKEKLIIPAWKEKLTLLGEDAQETIIMWNDHAKIDNMGTFRTYTLLVQGDDTELCNLTIENNADEAQAVALHVEADRVSVIGCRLIGNQDTVYLGKGGQRQFFYQCYIKGMTDYIFGPGTAWFEDCDLYCARNSYITASSTPENVAVGFVFNNCRITSAPNITRVFLGRPWRPFAYTVFMNSELDKAIAPEGWDNWRNPDNEKTARFAEFNNSAEGANTSKRVSWVRQLTAEEAAELTIENVLSGKDKWNPRSVGYNCRSNLQ